MRLFRRGRDAKTSVIGREALSTAESDADASFIPPSRPSSPVALVAEIPPAASSASLLAADAVPAAPPSYEVIEDSDVYVCEQDDADSIQSRAAAPIREVTLFVHQWREVEPGLLSWTFPSLRAALDAVQRMKNAIGWCIVSGTAHDDLDAARANGAILVEQLS